MQDGESNGTANGHSMKCFWGSRLSGLGDPCNKKRV